MKPQLENTAANSSRFRRCRSVVDHQTGQYNESHMQQEGHSHHDIKVVERILLNGTLEGHQQHTGADDIHHQRAHAGGAMVVDELELPQHVAHGHQQIQRNDLTAHRQKGFDHAREPPLSNGAARRCLYKNSAKHQTSLSQNRKLSRETVVLWGKSAYNTITYG